MQKKMFLGKREDILTALLTV